MIGFDTAENKSSKMASAVRKRKAKKRRTKAYRGTDVEYADGSRWLGATQADCPAGACTLHRGDGGLFVGALEAARRPADGPATLRTPRSSNPIPTG